MGPGTELGRASGPEWVYHSPQRLTSREYPISYIDADEHGRAASGEIEEVEVADGLLKANFVAQGGAHGHLPGITSIQQAVERYEILEDEVGVFAQCSILAEENSGLWTGPSCRPERCP